MSQRVVDTYRSFAEEWVKGVSDVYFDWASGVADEPVVASLISTLPRMKTQPNLVFAAARYLGCPVGDYQRFRDWLIANWARVEPVVMERATQTNEAARCAVLLPILSRLEGPLALIEAGASAGLCLYPDRYSYRYATESGVITLDPDDGPSPVQLPCEIDEADVPDRMPHVGWRAGVDLHPIDAADQSEVAWLEALVWPEHHERRDRLHAAAALVASDPPLLVPGDILTTVPTLVEQAPPGSRVVVFHSAVAAYLSADACQRFAVMMLGLEGVVWISNESAGVFSFIDQQLDEPVNGQFILAVNGTPVALTGQHGHRYRSLRAPAEHSSSTRREYP